MSDTKEESIDPELWGEDPTPPSNSPSLLIEGSDTPLGAPSSEGVSNPGASPSGPSSEELTTAKIDMPSVSNGLPTTPLLDPNKRRITLLYDATNPNATFLLHCEGYEAPVIVPVSYEESTGAPLQLESVMPHPIFQRCQVRQALLMAIQAIENEEMSAVMGNMARQAENKRKQQQGRNQGKMWVPPGHKRSGGMGH